MNARFKPILILLAACSRGFCGLDTAGIKAVYLQGEFDSSTAMLEGALAGPAKMDRNDSIFALKYLGTMRAANEATAEKARYYFHQLLHLRPGMELVDMFASERVLDLFKQVKREHEVLYPKETPEAEAGTETGPRADLRKPIGNTRRSGAFRGQWEWWLAGGALVTAIALGWIYFEARPEEDKVAQF
jgi:hypothetical protein